MTPRTIGTCAGALGGGLMGFWLASRRPWAKIKKVAATLGGGVVGGAVGYGVGGVVERRNAQTGWMDLYRVNADDDTSWKNKYPGEVPTAPIKKFPTPKEAFEGVKYGSPPTSLAAKTKNWGGSDGSTLLTSTSKLRAPSWSTRAGLTCPAVGYPIRLKLEEMVSTRKKYTDEQVLDELTTVVPAKCLSCYAMAGRYIYPEVQQAQVRRSRWFTEAPKKEVVETLVDAVSHAGQEKCDKESGECTFVPHIAPKHFRLFDSGDFNSARDVEIWYDVAKRLPEVKFWAPTTAHEVCEGYERPDHDKIISGLRELNKLPNVVVRPSGKYVGAEAGHFEGFGAGTTVVNVGKYSDTHNQLLGVKSLTKSNPDAIVEKTATKPSTLWVDIKGQRNWVCPGDCTFCRACWSKNVKVVYPIHTLTTGEDTTKTAKERQQAKRDQMMKLVRAATGQQLTAVDPSGKPRTAESRRLWESVNRSIAQYLIINDRVGPSRPAIKWARKRQPTGE